MDKIKLILAPLRGVTQLPFRRTLVRHFSGFDEAYSPFLTTMAGTKIKATHLLDIAPNENVSLPLVPQILGKNPQDFRTLLFAIKDLGYKRCDLNAACPWPMIVKRGRGSGLMKSMDNLRAMLDVGCDIFEGGLSLKVRLGVEHTDELVQKMDILNSYPLAALAIHARSAKQMYEGGVDLDNFAECLKAAKMPVIYNGDIKGVEDLKSLLGRFPGVHAWMIGRGAIRDPAIASRIRGLIKDEALVRLRDFALDYSNEVKEQLCGPAPFLGRMKEFWSYFKDSFPNGEVVWKKIRTAKSYDEYFNGWKERLF